VPACFSTYIKTHAYTHTHAHIHACTGAGTHLEHPLGQRNLGVVPDIGAACMEAEHDLGHPTA